MCGSNLSDFHCFDNISIIYWVKNRLKIERQTVSLWGTNLRSNFLNKWQPRISEIFAPLEITLGTQFPMRYGTKFIHAVLPSDGENYLLLLPGSVSLLSGGTV